MPGASGGYIVSNTGTLFAAVNVSSTLSVAGFGGASQVNFTAAQTGLQYIGFSQGGNVGFFTLDLQGAGVGDPLLIGSGFFNDSGGSIHVGAQIPEPASTGLGLLALGALGVRRNRKK